MVQARYSFDYIKNDAWAIKKGCLIINFRNGLQYKEYGERSAPLMLFIHGGGVSGWMWDKQIDYFHNYHCIVPDLFVQEREGKVEPFSIARCATMLIELIEEKAEGKEVIVAGFSLGAQIIIQMVSRRADLVDYAMINSALVKPMPITRKMIQPMIRMAFPLIKNRSFAEIQAKSLAIGPEYFEQYYEESCKMEQSNLIRILEENMQFTLPESFQAARCKMLITVGQNEKRVMLKSARDLVRANPNVVGFEIPNMGHVLPFSAPALFNKLLEALVEEKDPISVMKRFTESEEGA